MARTTLVDADIRRLKSADKPRKIKDSNGLYLLVSPSGSKLWRYRFELGGKESVCSLGAYPEVSLAAARQARDSMRQLVKQGANPAHHKREAARHASAQSSSSFEAVARKWMGRQPDWRDSYRRQVEKTLATEVFPVIGAKQFDQVTAGDLRGILDPIIDRDARSVAKLIQLWCTAICHFAVLEEKAVVNVASSLKGYFKAKKRTHHKPLNEKEIPVFLSRLANGAGSESVRIALQLLLLTFVRPGEIRCAVWSEFDLEQRIWTIPAPRMKKNREHVVPLSAQAVALLERLREIEPHKTFLFPNVRDGKRHMSPTTLNRYLERLGYGGKFSAHGFRATASTILNAKLYPPDAIEWQLSHMDRDLTRRSYNRAEYMPERIAMMQDWADYVFGLK